jgi:hypothetical protein
MPYRPSATLWLFLLKGECKTDSTLQLITVKKANEFVVLSIVELYNLQVQYCSFVQKKLNKSVSHGIQPYGYLVTPLPLLHFNTNQSAPCSSNRPKDLLMKTLR